MTQIATISTAENAAIDLAVKTAHMYPKHSTLEQIQLFSEKMLLNITSDISVAEQCFYAIYRKSYNPDTKKYVRTQITGPSIRLVEMMAQAWGNLRVGASLISNDGKNIVVSGICHDLENNVLISKEISVNIQKKNGDPFTADVQTSLYNAAMSKAIRNATLFVIPNAYTTALEKACTKYMEKTYNENKASYWKALLRFFSKHQINENQILSYLNTEEATGKDLAHLIQMKNGIEDGFFSAKDVFGESLEAKKEAMKNNDKPVEDLP